MMELLSGDLPQAQDISFDVDENPDEYAGVAEVILDYPNCELRFEIERAWVDGEEYLLEELEMDEIESISDIFRLEEGVLWLNARTESGMFMQVTPTDRYFAEEIAES